MKRARAPIVPLGPNTTSLTAKLFSDAQKGKDRALADLLARIQVRLLRFCFYLTGSRERAEDLSQEVQIKVMENLHSLDNPRNFVPWLFRITKNHFLDFVRSPRSREYVDLESLGESGSAHDPNPAELNVQLAQKLSRMTAEERYLVLLVCLEGRTYAEVGELVGLTEEAVRCKVYRVRKGIKQSFFTQKKVLGRTGTR